MSEESVRTEEFKINSDVLVAEIKRLLHEGNVRRIIIRTEQGRTLIKVPLTVGIVGGVIGVVALPVWVAIGAVAALAVRLTLVIEKVEPTAKDEIEVAPDASANIQEEMSQA